jgi:hypothetical protein
MMSRLASPLIALPLSLALAAACGNGGNHVHADADDFDCSATSADTYVAGLEKVGAAGVKVRLMESVPAPPAKGDNAWLLEIVGPGDDPLDDLDLTVVPWMPEHGHGTPKRPVIAPAAGDGRYQVDDVNLWMPGVWEITVTVDADGGLTDDVLYRFCIEG